MHAFSVAKRAWLRANISCCCAAFERVQPKISFRCRPQPKQTSSSFKQQCRMHGLSNRRSSICAPPQLQTSLKYRSILAPRLFHPPVRAKHCSNSVSMLNKSVINGCTLKDSVSSCLVFQYVAPITCASEIKQMLCLLE